MLTKFILQVNLINMLISGIEMNTGNCTFATQNKPFGYFDLNSGHADVVPFYQIDIENKDRCNRKCQYNENCYATAYDGQKCQFFNSSNFIIYTNGNIQYSQWKTCNTSEGTQPPDNRCLGLWITLSDKYIQVEQYEPFKNISTDYLNCRNKCLENPLCGFVNRFNKQCILVAKWPYENINITDMIDWEMDKWVCVDNFVNTFQPKNESKKPIVEKCTGHWEITNRNTILTRNQSKGLSFQTQIYENCLEECNQYPNCKTAWYNFNYSLCILKDVEISEFLFIPNETFINFEWKCETNDSHMPPLNSDEIKYLNLGMSCYKIVNATNLFIGRDKCGQCPHESEFHQCSECHHDKWNISDSCLEKQSYWSFPPTQISMNISGQLFRNLIKVFTGLQLYWIAFPDNHIKKIDYLECRHFNVTRPLEMLQINEIITKQEWYSQPPQGIINRFQSTPINIVITTSQQPFYSCRTKPACIDILRTLQVKYFHGIGTTNKFFDVPYNFMIDDSGHIYEGRGLKHECAAIYPFNENTICLAYIGWYDNKLPNEAYLSGIKKLIDYLEKHQYVVKDYTVYIHQDLTKWHIKRNLKIVIKNFYRYKDFLPEDCIIISFLLVIINFSIILIIFLITYFFYRFFNFNSACKRCKFFNYEDILISQIFPLNSDDPVHFVNTKLNGDTQNLIYEKHVSTSNVFKSIKLIKLWFFNKTLEAINSRFSHNNLQNYLSNMLRKETGISIYQFDSKNWSNIIIVSNSYRLNLLKQLIFNGKCICFYFTIEHIDFSDFPTDIQIVK